MFREIIEGWANLLFVDAKVEEIALKRLHICKLCEYNNTTPDIKMLSVCTLCHCPLEAKSRSLTAKCDKDKWPDLEQTQIP